MQLTALHVHDDLLRKTKAFLPFVSFGRETQNTERGTNCNNKSHKFAYKVSSPGTLNKVWYARKFKK